MSVADRPARPDFVQRHARRLAVRRAIVVALGLMLSVWLVGAAQSPSSGLVERLLLLLIAVMIPLHIIFWQLNGIRLLSRVRKAPGPVRIVVAMTALGTSPMVLYPLGLIAVIVSLVAGGGAATPALAVSGLVLLSPIILLFLIALMFAFSRHRV